MLSQVAALHAELNTPGPAELEVPMCFARGPEAPHAPVVILGATAWLGPEGAEGRDRPGAREEVAAACDKVRWWGLCQEETSKV